MLHFSRYSGVRLLPELGGILCDVSCNAEPSKTFELMCVCVCVVQDASKTSELIRKDMNELRSRFGFVKSSDCCRLCSTAVLSSGLYLFPCQHALHMQCVEHYMVRHGGLSSADKKRVKELKAALYAQDQVQSHGVGGGMPHGPPAPQAHGAAAPAASAAVDYARQQAELDDILASDCPICGIPAIRLLDQPLPQLPGGSSGWAMPPFVQPG